MIQELIQSAYRPKELSAILKIKFSGLSREEVKGSLDAISKQVDDKTFCYSALNKVSRSFAVVIRQLPEELKDAVCIFYLVLRGLDSVEDDATFPQEEKIDLLKNFYTKNFQTDWHIKGVGDSDDYRDLLANYEKVARSFQSLKPQYQTVINQICKEMGEGMAEFVERPLVTKADYDQYCHYVAGLVGIGLSDLFAASGTETPALSRQQDLANSMGLFLQKTNIIRDYHEDLHLDRVFWPSEVWSKYADNLEDFEKAPHREESLACLNELVCDALRHVQDCLEYQYQLKHPEVFRFCAIPQVMALATLSKLYNNPKVFTGVVKIRKGLAARLMTEVNDFDTLRKYFEHFSQELLDKLQIGDRHYDPMCKELYKIRRMCREEFTYDYAAPAIFH